MNRREFVKALGLAGAALAVPALAPARPRRQRGETVLRIGFLTDVHLPAKGRNDEASRALQAMQQKGCDLLVFGGDNVFSAENVSRTEADDQFGNWHTLISKEVSVPHISCIGNHDLAGHDGQAASAGKGSAMKAYGMQQRFSVIRKNGWRLITLDAVQRTAKGYRGEVDAAQLKWLEQELMSDATPTVVVSHIPILSVTAIAGQDAPRSSNGFRVPFDRTISNCRDLISIFAKTKNVRLALSGHMHMVDTVNYKGTKYHCSGAVCGGWWKGEYQGFGPSMCLAELSSTGMAMTRMMPLGLSRSTTL